MTLSHEKLTVYQRSIEFVGWLGPLLDGLASGGAAKNQLDRASTSVPLNIAEAQGRFSTADRSHFLQIASGSALECAAALDVLVARNRLERTEIEQGKRLLVEIVSMLRGLRKSVATRLGETEGDYGTPGLCFEFTQPGQVGAEPLAQEEERGGGGEGVFESEQEQG